MEEIDRVRSRVISTESQGLTLHEKFSLIHQNQKVHSDKLQSLEDWNTKLTRQIEETTVEAKKIDGLIKAIERVQSQHKKIR